MKLHLRIEPRVEYLYAEFTGIFDLGEAKALSIRILASCIECRLAKVLVDHRSVEGQITIIERWDYSDFIARQVHEHAIAGRLRAPRFAYLGRNLVDPGRFGEVVAVNRGVIVKSTTRADEAFRWLGVEHE